MMVIEMREAAKDKAFGLLEEIKDLGHKKKLALCELEDALYECFEKEDEREEEDEESEVNYRRGRGYRSRKSYMREHGDYEDDDEYEMEKYPKHYRRSMRMRRY